MTYSQIVYLFADQLVSDRSGFVNYHLHPTGQKISVKPLSELLVLSALIYLIDQKYLSLTVADTKKLFFLPGQDVFVKALKKADPSLAWLESSLLDASQSESKLQKSVYNILGQDDISPWGQIIGLVRDDLAKQGHLIAQQSKRLITFTKKYSFAKDPSSFQSHLDQFQKALSQFSNTAIFPLVKKAISSGIAKRKETPSGADD